LYQFYPDRVNTTFISKILVKALTQLPATDFLCCQYLIADSIQQHEPFISLSKLSLYLESGNYAEFWNFSRGCRDLVSAVPGFDDAIRDFMASVICRTYHTITLKQLGEHLSLQGQALDSFIKRIQCTIEGQLVIFPRVEDGQRKQQSERIPFDQLSKILSQSQC
jgi:translation initiation factor 3 subunit K